MSEIKRTNEHESYPITVDWISDFAKKLASNPVPPSPFSSTAAKEKFATIEDKMIDIKNRVGFNSIKKMSDNSADDDKIVTSSNKCKCTGKCSCKNLGRVESLKVILNYIRDMIESEPHLLPAEIISRCRENKDLNYDSTRIRQEKINNFIDRIKNIHPNSKQEVKYLKQDDLSESRSDDVADYYQHGLPAST